METEITADPATTQSQFSKPIPKIKSNGLIYPFSEFIAQKITAPYVSGVYHNERVPKDGPFIAVANHTSYFDGIILAAALFRLTSRKLHILVDARCFNTLFRKWFFGKLGLIPVAVDRNSSAHERQKINNGALNRILKATGNGENAIVFPEGGRGTSSTIQKAKLGVAKIALAARVPILPIGMEGTYELIGNRKLIPKFKRISIHIGKPLSFNHSHSRKHTAASLEEVTRTIMQNIAALIGQKYQF